MKQKRKQLPEKQKPADGKLLQWHPAFYADLQIEFREETEKYSASIILSNINHHPIHFLWMISIRYMDIRIFIKQIQGR